MANELDSSVSSLVLGSTLPHGLAMLEQTFIRLAVPQPDRCMADALIESFCAHAKQLIDFFENRQGVQANQFTGGTYVAQHTHTVPAAIRNKLDQSLARQRNAGENETLGSEERAQLLLEVVSEARHFMSRLSEPDRALLQSKYRSAVKSMPVSEGAPSGDESVEYTDERLVEPSGIEPLTS